MRDSKSSDRKIKTVRLPIYDENGMEVPGYLEIDTLYFLSSTAGLRSNLARIVLPVRESPYSGELRDCGNSDCEAQVMYLADTWYHYDHPSHIDHPAVPKVT